MLFRLCSNGFFNLADGVLDFSGILFSSAISLQIGVLRDLAGRLPDYAFDFVKLACCLIVCARFHHDSLFCSVVAFNSLRSKDVPCTLTIRNRVRPLLSKGPGPM